MNLIMFCYNFLRTQNILGFNTMLETIKNWQPDYTKIVCALKKGAIQTMYNQNEPSVFFQRSPSFILTAA